MKNCILSRSKLIRLFSYTTKHKITVAIAPMGYGKTFAASKYLLGTEYNSIWLSIECKSQNVYNIWETFCRQISKYNSKLSNILTELDFPNTPKKRNYLIKNIDKYINKRTILVIDDYHYAQSKELDNLIYYAVRANIKNLHILILSRTKPDIHLEEFKLKSHCFVIDSSSFILSKSEVGSYLMKYGLNTNRLDDVYKLSEGWISAVKLIAEKLKIDGDINNITSINNLVKETILAKFNSSNIKVLTGVCLLDSFTVKQASYVLKVDEDILKKLLKSTPFIAYDSINDIYRVHKILENYFKSNKVLTKPEYLILNQRRGTWFIENNQLYDGIQCLLIAKDYSSILSVMSTPLIVKLYIKHPQFMIRVYSAIPSNEKLMLKHSSAILYYLSFIAPYQPTLATKEEIDRVELFYKNKSNLTEDNLNKILGELSVIKGVVSFNELEVMNRYFSRGYEELKGKSYIANEKRRITLGHCSLIHMCWKIGADLDYALNLSCETFGYYTKLANGCGSGFSELIKAEALLERLEIDKALIYLNKGYDKAKAKNQYDIMMLINFQKARSYVYMGNFNEAYNIIQCKEIKYQLELLSITSCQLDLCLSYINILLKKLDIIPEWLFTNDFTKYNHFSHSLSFNYVIHGKLLIKEKRYLELDILTDDMLLLMNENNNLHGLLHCYIQKAIAKLHLNEYESSNNFISKAFLIASENKVYLSILEYGNEIKNILNSLNLNTDYVKKVRGLLLPYLDETPIKHIKLTKREQDIIELILIGKSNKEISQHLHIAEITVKKNLSNIYKKHKVKNRKELIIKLK